MAEADYFSNLVRKVKKNSQGTGGEALLLEVEQVFVGCFPDLPDDLKFDLFYFFSDRYAKNLEFAEIEVLGDKLLELITLLDEDYGRTGETFDVEEWSFIRDSISDFGLDIDEKQLTYIMQQIVSRGHMR